MKNENIELIVKTNGWFLELADKYLAILLVCKMSFLPKEFFAQLKTQKQEVKKQFVEIFAQQFSLVTRDELHSYEIKLQNMTQKLKDLEDKLAQK